MATLGTALGQSFTTIGTVLNTVNTTALIVDESAKLAHSYVKNHREQFELTNKLDAHGQQNQAISAAAVRRIERQRALVALNLSTEEQQLYSDTVKELQALIKG